MKPRQIEAYASARSSERFFYYIRNHNSQEASKYARDFLVDLSIYERFVPPRIRKTLHNFAQTKDIASTVINVDKKERAHQRGKTFLHLQSVCPRLVRKV